MQPNTEYTIDLKLFEYISIEAAYNLNAWPIALDSNTITFITSDKTNHLLPTQLTNISGHKSKILIVSKDEIDKAIKAIETASKVLQDVSHSFRSQNPNENDEDITNKEEGPIAKLINKVIMDAVQKRASDIHFEAYENSVIVKYRIDGVLYTPLEPLDKQYLSMLVSRIKIMAELDIAERRIPQDGRFSYNSLNHFIDCRVSTLPSVHGEDVVVRILDKKNLTNETNKLSLDILGMNDDVLQKLRKAINEPYGMILVTGPTGSGKTTTLYSAISELNVIEEKVITIEDPVEYQLYGAIQIAVNEKKGLNFAKGLRAILRHDPDKIMVGEIRDVETAQIAVQAALTGHLVFSTVHANNVFDVVGRFRHMGLSVYDFISSLNCIIAQRLIRNLCSECKVIEDIDESTLKQSKISPDLYKEKVFFKAVGCEQCNFTGYNGRSAIVELLELTQEMKDILMAQESMSVIKQHAYINGFSNLRSSAIKKFINGTTSLREINRVTFIE